jgi:hypothetical protein
MDALAKVRGNMKKKFYRDFPAVIKSPITNQVISRDEFENLENCKMQEAPSVCPGHKSTTIWYAGKEGYLVQVAFDEKPDVYVKTVCTVIPQFGMDSFDGMLAQDAEEYVLHNELGYETERLKVFTDCDEVGIQTYLKSRGINWEIKRCEPNGKRKPWWKFWR